MSRITPELAPRLFFDLMSEGIDNDWCEDMDAGLREEEGIAMFQSRCALHFAKLLRRQGKGKDAEQHLFAIWPKVSTLRLETVATFEYEIAFTYFLRGRLRFAADLMCQSAGHAALAGDVVGEWISRRLEYRMRFLSNPESVVEFRTILTTARQVFRRVANESAAGSRDRKHAESWQMSACDL